MKLAMQKVIGGFRVLRKRAVQMGQPGLSVWADAGEAAAQAAAQSVSKLSHANECDEREVASDLEAIIGDGQVTAAELNRLRVIAPRLRRCAERCHDIGEVVRL